MIWKRRVSETIKYLVALLRSTNTVPLLTYISVTENRSYIYQPALLICDFTLIVIWTNKDKF